MNNTKVARIASMIGIIAFIAIIGMSISACNRGAGGGIGKKKFTWTAITNEQSGLAVDTQLFNIVYGNGNFVALKYNEFGEMAHSADGITWTELNQQQTTFDYSINGIIWGNDKFVAIGNETMAYSSDGKTWTAIAHRSAFNRRTSGRFEDITWGNGKFVASVSDGRMAYSSDGVAWTFISAVQSTFGDGGTFGWILRLAYGNDKFIAMASSPTGSEGSKIAYSADGINWTESSTANVKLLPGSRFFYGCDKIVWANDKFIGAKGSQLLFSPDGLAWSYVEEEIFRVSASRLSRISGITWGNGIYVAGGQFGRIATSPDGIAWTVLPEEQNIFTDNMGIHGLIYANDKFIATGGISRSGGDGIIAIGEYK
ncbi:MAG: hypothetical protein FWC01_08215 [Treponema sp.]|nr:hypothetical protein [Treponema sp.]MCL2237896.1 hypothetical protein [Treponema sp.]